MAKSVISKISKVEESRNRKWCGPMTGSAGGFWFLGFIGSLVYYWSSVESLWTFLVAVFRALFWPAYLVYGLLKVLSL
ncbi:hypothetical protein HY346_02300 [Candidatus Microgenomates bacterium]|nr:hypothetical protein [Candidatus Microgenomates bacterium]